MSPLSDTTGIAASIVGVDLFEHIKNMLYTTLPAFIISAIVFGVFSPWNQAGDISSVAAFKEDILSTGLVHGYALLPFILLLIFSIDRKSTRLNSSHANISYAVFCLKKKKYAFFLF